MTTISSVMQTSGMAFPTFVTSNAGMYVNANDQSGHVCKKWICLFVTVSRLDILSGTNWSARQRRSGSFSFDSVDIIMGEGDIMMTVYEGLQVKDR